MTPARWWGNTLLRVGGTAGTGPEVYVTGSSVLDNDAEFLGDTYALMPIVNGSSVNGGTVNLAADGSFTYLPPTGFTGNDTFTYTLRDDGTDNIAGNGDDLTGTGRVTLTVSNRVWYVDSTAAAGGSGRANAPFNALSAAQAASAVNDYIYVYERSGDYNGNLTLKNGQRLIGSGVALVVGSNTLLAAGSNTTWTNTGGDAITLAQNNTVQGLTIGDTAGTDIIGASVGTLNISNVTLTGGGRAFAITTGGTLGVTFQSLSSTSGTNAVSLTGCDGNLTISGGTVNGPTGDDVVLNGGSLSVSFQATITNSTGRSVNITNKTGGTVAFSGQITDTGTGILCDNNDQSGGTATIVFTGGLNISTGGAMRPSPPPTVATSG